MPSASESHRPQLVRRVLVAILILGFISGVISGYYEADKVPEPVWSEIGTTLLTLFLILTWYHIDSNEHQYKRNIWLNVVILGFAIFGIPYYLMRSRPPGKRLAALGRLSLFTLIFFGVSVLGEYLMIWIL